MCDAVPLPVIAPPAETKVERTCLRDCYCDCLCRCLCDSTPSAHGVKASALTPELLRADKSKRKGGHVDVRAAPARETMGDSGSAAAGGDKAAPAAALSAASASGVTVGLTAGGAPVGTTAATLSLGASA